MQVIKRDGRKVDFDKNKIKEAVLKAFNEVYPNAGEDNISESNNVCDAVCNSIDKFFRILVGYCIESIIDNIEPLQVKEDTVQAKNFSSYLFIILIII